MRVVAVYNIKGGVGKTATAVNLAWLAAESGQRTLLWDLDPQGAASFYFRVQPKVSGGVRRLLKAPKKAERHVKGTDFAGLDLLPADFSYRHFDLKLDRADDPARGLRKLLRELGEDYDLVLLDCPPGISLLSEAVFSAADVLVVPTIPTTLSLRTLVQLVRFLKDMESASRPRLLPFFSMVDGRKGLHRSVVETYQQKKTRLLHSLIPYASEVEQMGLHRAPLFAYAGRSKAALAFRELWQELRPHLG